MERRTEAGFTLLELLMAMTISTAIMGSIVVVTGQFQQSYYRQIEGASVQHEARFAIDQIVRDLKIAGNNPLTISTSACPSSGNVFRAVRRDPNADNVQNDIRIHSDLNGNKLLGGQSGSCNEAGEDVTIQLNTTDRVIQRRDNNTQMAAVNITDSVITGLSFAYLNASRATTTSDAAVSFIQITVTATTPTGIGQARSYTETAEVRVRTR